MVLANPLPVNGFARVIRKQSVKFELAYNNEQSGLPKGQRIVAEMGDPYWTAEFGLINMEGPDARKVQGLFESMDGGIRDFYLYDPRCEFPIADPDGSILGAATVQITTTRNANELKFQGPNGYTYTPGDMFHYDYGPSLAYRALHRIVGLDPIVANGAGATDWFEIRPYLPDPSVGTPKTVTLIRPSCRMKLELGGYDSGTARQMMTSGMTFRCNQVP